MKQDKITGIQAERLRVNWSSTDLVLIKPELAEMFPTPAAVNAALDMVMSGLMPINPDGFWAHRSPPTRSFLEAAALFDRLSGQTIVEIGTGIAGEMIGNSMLAWANKTSAKRIIAVDPLQARLDEVKQATEQFSNVELVLSDGIAFLNAFDSKIDLLYLDVTQNDAPGALPGTARAELHRDIYQAARDKLGRRALILIDDTDHIDPWKQTYIVPDARKDGFTAVYIGRQTLLMRRG